MRIALLIAVVFLCALVVAQPSQGGKTASGSSGSSRGSSSGSSGPASKGPQSRKPSIKVNNNQLMITSVSQTDTFKDKLSFTIKTNGGNTAAGNNGLLDVRFGYYAKSDDAKEGFSYGVRVFSIIEFLESGATAGYQPAEDTLVQRWRPTSWGNFVTSTRWAGELQIDEFTATADNIFLVRGEVVGVPIAANGTRPGLNPNSVKFDFEVNNFPYKNTSSSLALETVIVSKTKVAQGPASKVSAITVTGEGDVVGEFTWVDHVEISGGRNASVIASQIAKDGDDTDGQMFKTYFAFNTTAHPSAILWDPSVGAAYSSDTPPAPVTSSASVSRTSIATLLLVSVAVAAAIV
eukprot:CAMPEP_0114545568 /NCGR_PEP_ID=MMETSP0114-20121206/3474_1 /TAXON_ID=31324 /ORGANISM="Goniomonas sp, Strain m" /LENGTH=348 /DNA_ID=CAMNT_0001730013 /DNA_START=26 /DNA_END=1072 /DNA_ORIENTATION=+